VKKEVMHRAARLEDRYHAWRERRVRKGGHTPTVVAYPGYSDGKWVRVMCRVLLTPNYRVGSRAERAAIKRRERIRGWRSFVAVPVNSAVVRIRIGNETFDVTADRGGVVDEVVKVKLAPGRHTVYFSCEGSAESEATIRVTSKNATVGLICDVDDTVMVTALPRPFLAAWNSFVLDEHARVPTPGMAVFLTKLAGRFKRMPVIYLSTGAWNVAPTLTRFLSRNMYPEGALLLTDWGPTHDRMFRSGRAHKETSLRRLAKEFPHVKWILVGDDGQHDQQIYGEFQKEFPKNVAAVCIRRLSASEAVFAGTSKKHAEQYVPPAGAPWVYGHSGATLMKQLKKVL
jgi:phosphatidate phosphatase APP1